MRSRIAVSALFIMIAATLFTSDATAAFEKLKTLHRSWPGKACDSRAVQVLDRITSRGSALLSEFQAQKDMVTVIHFEGDRLLITRYRANGNQPRVVGSISPDGKTVTLNSIDATNLLSSPAGHMQRLVFNLIDSGHHTESLDFTMAEGKQQMHDLLDQHRSK
jgi:hypothetical protein